MKNLILVLILCTSSWAADDRDDPKQGRRWTTKQPRKLTHLPKEPQAIENPLKPRISKRPVDDVDVGEEDEDPYNDEDRKRRVTDW